ncbi:hypothetical protein M2480_001547 [Parabacteroides sp. PFB2-12]|nr:hypothetical protein [Parabacteroides sp. PM6-13]MDH6390572.1 hypothetical protein [Parabacteroides sp. PFB2-12]
MTIKTCIFVNSAYIILYEITHFFSPCLFMVYM